MPPYFVRRQFRRVNPKLHTRLEDGWSRVALEVNNYIIKIKRVRWLKCPISIFNQYSITHFRNPSRCIHTREAGSKLITNEYPAMYSHVQDTQWKVQVRATPSKMARFFTLIWGQNNSASHSNIVTYVYWGLVVAMHRTPWNCTVMTLFIVIGEFFLGRSRWLVSGKSHQITLRSLK